MDVVQGTRLTSALPSAPTPTNKTSTDWASYFLNPDNHADLHQYAPYLSYIYNLLSTANTYMSALITQISQKPDLATIALLLIILFISLKILDMLWQTVKFWLRLLSKVLFWGGLVALSVWMYARGPEGIMDDVEYWWGDWSKNYEYWRDRERVAGRARQGVNYGAQGRGGGRRPQQGGRWY
jgi:hypothetical protein